MTEGIVLADAAMMKTVALLIFFGIFLGLVIWLALTRSSAFARSAQLPLDDKHVLEPRVSNGNTTDA